MGQNNSIMIKNKENKKYLVVLAGSPRGGEKTWKSLTKKVIEPLNADLAICTDIWDEKNLLSDAAKYKWIVGPFKNYESYYEENFKGSWKTYFNTGLETGLYSSGLIHFLFKDIIKNNFLNDILNYDYLIYSRFDQYYVNEHPQIQSDNILIPKGEDYFGICDRHAILPTKYAHDFLNICSYIDSDKALNEKPTFNNCETTFMNHLKHINLYEKIKRIDRVQFTSSLKSDKTNWRVPKYKVHFYKDLMIKYPDEFIDGVRNSININTFYKYFLMEPVLTLNYIYLKLRRLVGNIRSASL